MAHVAQSSIDEQIGGGQPPRTDDPAFKPPVDPLKEKAFNPAIIRREIPIQTVGTGWDIAAVRTALDQQVLGQFDWPAQLCDSLMADSRVQSALRSRVGGLLGRPVDFRVPRKYRDSAAARECRDAFADLWQTMASEASLGELQRWAILLGFGLAQEVWDLSGEYATPLPQIWHPRFTYWHWTFRRLVALTQDGPTAVQGGDGHWIFHAPHGDRGGYRSWMQGADRAIGPWWLARFYALRDANRWSERHGFPIIKAKTPARGDPDMINQWRADLQNLGQEAVLQIPQEVTPGASYDAEFLEAKDTGHEVFGGLISLCNTEITLSLQSEILTSTTGPEGRGSYAAARVHGDTKQTLIEADARALELTARTQIGRPFALLNFAEPDLAPLVVWDVTPYEDRQTRANTALAITQALVNLANAGHRVRDPERVFREFGVDLGDLEAVAPKVSGVDVPPAAEKDGKARFAEAATEIGRLRIALGETSRAQVEAETAALIEWYQEDETSRRTMARLRATR